MLAESSRKNVAVKVRNLVPSSRLTSVLLALWSLVMIEISLNFHFILWRMKLVIPSTFFQPISQHWYICIMKILYRYCKACDRLNYCSELSPSLPMEGFILPFSSAIRVSICFCFNQYNLSRSDMFCYKQKLLISFLWLYSFSLLLANFFLWAHLFFVISCWS